MINMLDWDSFFNTIPTGFKKTWENIIPLLIATLVFVIACFMCMIPIALVVGLAGLSFFSMNHAASTFLFETTGSVINFFKIGSSLGSTVFILLILGMQLGLFLGVQLLSMGYQTMLLEIGQGRMARMKLLFSYFSFKYVPFGLRVLLAKILYGGIVFIGFIFFVIPGLIMIARLRFYYYAMLEKNYSIHGAFCYSWNITQGYTFKMMVINGILWIIKCLGHVVVPLLFLFTNPAMDLALISLYYDLEKTRITSV